MDEPQARSWPIPGILAWIDAWQKRRSVWPNYQDGVIPESGGETWRGVDTALRKGLRGLDRGQSLDDLVAERRIPRNHLPFPLLTEEQILHWSDLHHRRTGSWPRARSGPVVDAPGENWAPINGALIDGSRGLPGQSSLRQLLEKRRSVPPGSEPSENEWLYAPMPEGEWWVCIDPHPLTDVVMSQGTPQATAVRGRLLPPDLAVADTPATAKGSGTGRAVCGRDR